MSCRTKVPKFVFARAHRGLQAKMGARRFWSSEKGRPAPTAHLTPLFVLVKVGIYYYVAGGEARGGGGARANDMGGGSKSK